MLTNQSLQEIQAGEDKRVYSTVTNVALYMATGGYLAIANQLLSALWNYKMPHDRDTWLADTAFMVLWNAAGSRPEFVPFSIDDIDSLERNIRGYIATDKWVYKMPDRPWQELAGQDLWRKAIQTARMVKGSPGSHMDYHAILNEETGDFSNFMEKVSGYINSINVEESDAFPSTEDELETLAILRKMIAEGYYPTDGLALGAELAARNGQRDIAVRFCKLWAENVVRNPLGCNFPVLACNRYVAPFLLEGVIGLELGLSESFVGEYFAEILAALDSRMKKGRTLFYDNLNWAQLIAEISRGAVGIEGADIYDEGIRKSEWIGFVGASSYEIALVEERLQIQLPDDYKSFLETTNGIRAFPLSNPGLGPVEQINKLANVIEPYFFDIIVSLDADEENNIRNAILISKYPDEQLVWLTPINAEQTRWETWFYASWMPGAEKFPSFRFYMEDALAGMKNYK